MTDLLFWLEVWAWAHLGFVVALGVGIIFLVWTFIRAGRAPR